MCSLRIIRRRTSRAAIDRSCLQRPGTNLRSGVEDTDWHELEQHRFAQRVAAAMERLVRDHRLMHVPTRLIVGGDDFGVIDLNEHAMARLCGPKSLQIVPHASHLFPEQGALEAVIDHAARWLRQYLAPSSSHRGASRGRA